MSSLSVTSLFSSVSGGLSRRPLVEDVVSSDAESVEDSSRVVGPLSRESMESTVSLSLSGYEGEETREAKYVWGFMRRSIKFFFCVYRGLNLMLHL